MVASTLLGLDQKVHRLAWGDHNVIGCKRLYIGTILSNYGEGVVGYCEKIVLHSQLH